MYNEIIEGTGQKSVINIAKRITTPNNENGNKAIIAIYRYLGGTPKGAREFIEHLRKTVEFEDIMIKNSRYTVYNQEQVVEELWKIPEFIDRLEEEGLDTWDRMYYWGVVAQKR